MIEDPEIFALLPPFQRPVRCPECHKWVLRDQSVVNNSVVCPYENCQKSFCWICLTEARESETYCDHYSSVNVLKCYGSQYEDVRNSTLKKLACKKAFKLLILPFLSIYSSATINLGRLNQITKRFHKMYLPIKIILTALVYIIMGPLILVLGGLIQAIILFIFALAFQVTKIGRICFRNNTCCRQKSKDKPRTTSTIINPSVEQPILFSSLLSEEDKRSS